MAEWIDLDSMVDTLAEFLVEFEGIISHSHIDEMQERVARWKIRLVKWLRSNVNNEEAQKYSDISMGFSAYDMGGFDGMLQRHRTALVVLAEELARHPAQFFGPTDFIASRPSVRRVFVSHAADDRPIADYLRDEMIARRPGIEVFLASRPGHIKTGDGGRLSKPNCEPLMHT